MRNNLKEAVPFELRGEGLPKVAIIGEAPGEVEVEQGRPFVGPSGILVSRILEDLNWNEPYLVANTVQCPPRDGKGRITTPQGDAISTCSRHAHLITKAFPSLERIILLGKVAAQSWGFSGPMEDLVSRNPYRALSGHEVWILYHPAYILRRRDPKTLEAYRRLWAKALGISRESDERLNYRVLPGELSSLEEAWAHLRGTDWSLDFETIGSEVREDRPILGIGLGNAQHQFYIDTSPWKLGYAYPERLRALFSRLLEMIRETQEAGRHVLAYNQSFEMGVIFQVIGELVYLTDVWSLAKAKGYSGSLKDLAHGILGAPLWAEEVQDLVSWAKEIWKAESNKPGILEKLILGEEKGIPKSILEAWNSKPQYQELLRGHLAYWQSNQHLGPMVGWSLIPEDWMGLYNARDTYWTTRLWEALYPGAESYFHWYQYQERLSALIQIFGLRWDQNKYEELTRAFSHYYVRSLLEFVSNPRAEGPILEAHFWNQKVGDVPELREKLNLDKASKKISKISPYLQMDLKTLWEKAPESAWEYEFIGYAHKVEPLLREKQKAAFKSDLKEAERLIQDGYYKEAQELLEKWYNPFSHKNALKVFEQVIEVPQIFWSLILRAYQISMPDTRFLEKVERLGPTNTWLPRILEEGPKFLLSASTPSELKALQEQYEEMRSGLKESFFGHIYQALLDYAGIDLSVPESWPREDPELYHALRAIRALRIAKKSSKMLDSYLNGKAGSRMAFSARWVSWKGKYPAPLGSPESREYAIVLDYIANGADTKRWRSTYHTMPQGTEVKEIYGSRWGKDGLLIHYDYSQMEVRVLAALAKDEKLLEILNQPKSDVHLMTASLLFGLPPEQIQSHQRRYAKTATFAILYGKSLESFALDYLSGDTQTAQKIFDAYFQAFPRIREWIQEMHRIATLQGKVPTLFGDLVDVQVEESGYLRRAQNYPVQSSASSLAAISGYLLWEACYKEGIRAVPIGFVHDALEFDVYIPDLPRFLQLWKYWTVQWPREALGVPVEADMEIGPYLSWTFETEWDDVQTLEVKGISRHWEELLERLGRHFHLEIEDLQEEPKTIGEDILWVGRNALSLYLGKEVSEISAKIKLEPR